MISRRCVLLAVVSAMISTPASAGQQVELGTQEGVVLQATGPTRVTLRSPDAAELAARFANLTDRRFTLALRGLTADREPGTVYSVYLDAREGEILSPADPGFAGTLTFFGAPKAPATPHPRGISYEISEALAKLQRAGRLEGPLTVTIVPGRPPASDSHPMIEKISLIAE